VQENTQTPWGWITLIDAAYCDEQAINDKQVFQSFIDELLERIEMVKIGDLSIIWCETNDPNKVGYSIYQLLQDSNVSAHFCPSDRNAAYMDVFSCKKYDEDLVKKIFVKYFKPKTIKYQTVNRLAPEKTC
jgi:S-adenosylmethionine/arginine decarboxylase-like enzyme